MKPVSQGRCFWAMNNVKSLLNMLCAVDLRRIFVPQAKTILLVKQRHVHLFTDSTDMSYSLLKTNMTQVYLVNCRSAWVIQKRNKKKQPGFFFLQFYHKKKVWFNDDESASSWANIKRQVHPPSLVTVHPCLWLTGLWKSPVDTSWDALWLGFNISLFVASSVVKGN